MQSDAKRSTFYHQTSSSVLVLHDSSSKGEKDQDPSSRGQQRMPFFSNQRQTDIKYMYFPSHSVLETTPRWSGDRCGPGLCTPLTVGISSRGRNRHERAEGKKAEQAGMVLRCGRELRERRLQHRTSFSPNRKECYNYHTCTSCSLRIGVMRCLPSPTFNIVRNGAIGEFSHLCNSSRNGTTPNSVDGLREWLCRKSTPSRDQTSKGTHLRERRKNCERIQDGRNRYCARDKKNNLGT